ncbi:MAG TPA: hypothetical protein VGC86_15470 [Afipia sp.]
MPIFFFSAMVMNPYAGSSKQSAAKKVVRQFGAGNKMPRTVSSGMKGDLKRDQPPMP